MEEEVAAVEVDEVDHRGPVKIGGVLWVVSHNTLLLLLSTHYDWEILTTNQSLVNN